MLFSCFLSHLRTIVNKGWKTEKVVWNFFTSIMTWRTLNINGSRETIFIFFINYWLFTLTSHPEHPHQSPVYSLRRAFNLFKFTKEVISFSIHLREQKKQAKATRENKGSEKSSLLQVISSLWLALSLSLLPLGTPSASTNSLCGNIFCARDERLNKSEWKAKWKWRKSFFNFLRNLTERLLAIATQKQRRDGILWIRCAVWFMSSAGKTL